MMENLSMPFIKSKTLAKFLLVAVGLGCSKDILCPASASGLRLAKSSISSVVDSRQRTRRLQQGVWRNITFDDFDFGWGSFTKVSGTSSASRVQGNVYWYLKIQDNLGDLSSVFYKQDYDVASYAQLSIRFRFLPTNMDTSDGFYVEYTPNSGLNWYTVKRYRFGTDFVNDALQIGVLSLSPSMFAFSKNARIRFQCDATSTDGGRIYIDYVEFSGQLNASPTAAQPTPEIGTPTAPQPTPAQPTVAPYVAGNLRPADAYGIKWSVGLTGKIIARTGYQVPYTDGSGGVSTSVFHIDPDAGACYPLKDGSGGWVYVSNSEEPSKKTNGGGVGAIYFNAVGQVKHYEWVLKSDSNCGGGKSPWGTWLSCEEDGSTGDVFEVDPQGPFGNTTLHSKYKYGRMTCLGEGNGNFESATFDGRQLDLEWCQTDLKYCKVDFFVSHDDDYGEVRKYTPTREAVQSGCIQGAKNGDYSSILALPSSGYSGCSEKRDGGIFYLKITSGSGKDSGSFTWTTSKYEGQLSAYSNYPYNEGIDVKDGRMYLVSKTYKYLFIFDLDHMTWTRSSTFNGAFDGQPDQVYYITKEKGGLLYFTEDASSTCGVHARNATSGEYVTIFESTGSYYTSETTGLSFSPDMKHMYVAYQAFGHVWDVTRDDGLPFHGEMVDIKYHA